MSVRLDLEKCWRDILAKIPTELTKIMDGGVVYGAPRARSIKFRMPWRSVSKEEMDRLKSTFHASSIDDISAQTITDEVPSSPLCMIRVTEC